MDSPYILEHGLRRVRPYYFEYKTAFKQRWANMTAKSVLCKELGQLESVLEASIDRRHVYVTKNNGKAGGPVAIEFDEMRSHKLKPHDIIYNVQHMHEPSVVWDLKAIGGFGKYNGSMQHSRSLESGVGILYENDEVVAVSKPGGIPTHPGGIYRLNTMTEILKHELGIEVWPCHRLDKATLGVLMMAKTKASCKKLTGVFQEKGLLTSKQYVARVKGNFKSSALKYVCPVFTVNSASKGYINVPNSSEVSATSTTLFEKLGYLPETDESIVMCQPISGKMHQIRVHLRNLGFPISNDPLYSPATEVNQWKNEIELEIYARVFEKWPQLGIQHEDTERLERLETSEVSALPVTIDVALLVLEEIRSRITDLANARKQTETEESPTFCDECGRQAYSDNPDLGIYLHAFKLEHHDGDNLFEFQTDYPAWCQLQDKA